MPAALRGTSYSPTIESIATTPGEDDVRDRFTPFVGTHHAHVWRLARALVGAQDADDVVQQVFIAASRKDGKRVFVPDLDLSAQRAWLERAVRNEASQVYRSRSRRRRLVERLGWATPRDRGDATDDDLPDDDDQLLLDSWDRLAGTDRRLLHAQFIARMSHAEIAAELGCRADTARKRCNRALERLRRLYEEVGGR